VAAATVVAGGLAGLLLQGRTTAMLLAALAALVIGISRLVLGVHSPTEVIIGACVGLAGAWVLLELAGPRPTRLDAWRVAVIAAIVALIFHGLHLPAEAHIRLTARRVSQIFGVCQSDMHRLHIHDARE
jgi:membrane-associated phospholipid phosphatase